LTQADDGGEDKSTLAQKDIRFARTITRLQRSVVSELEKIAVVHLYTLGYKGKDLLSFKLHLNPPSKLAELQELEHWRTKFEIAGSATEGYFSRRWVSKNLLNLSDEEIIRNQREMFYDAQLNAELEMAATPPEMGGGEMPMEDMGMEDMGGEDMGMEELGGEELAAEAPDEGTEEETLLAAPGKRNDLQWKRPDQKPYTTPGAKGKVYIPVKHDNRKSSGPRRRSRDSKYSRETSKNTERNIFKGKSELNQLARMTYEEQQTNYKSELISEELKILKNNTEIQRMIESLDKGISQGKKKNGKV
jgi:hypothetical protein